MEVVRELRRRKGWSQQDLADASGVGQDTISSLELGRHQPRPSTLRKIAAAFGVEVADLFREVATAGPLGERAAEGPERPRDLPPLENPRVVAVLREWGYVPDTEYVAALQRFDPEIDEEGIPRGVESAIENLQRDRDRLLEELRRPTNYKRLFPPLSGLSKSDKIEAVHERSRLASRLRTEVRRVYNRRILALANFSKALYDADETEDFLVPARMVPVVEAAHQRMLEALYAGQKAG